MLLELKQEVCFNKDDLNFEMIDPYYLEDLRKMDFGSLQATPIFDGDDLSGVLITYYKDVNGKICRNTGADMQIYTGKRLLFVIVCGIIAKDKERRYIYGIQ